MSTELPDPLLLRRPPVEVRAKLRPPGSKSLSNRALLLAALADGPTTIHGCLDAEDTRLMLAALTELGVDIETLGATLPEGLRVGGGGLGRARRLVQLQVGTAGTVARFLTAAIAASPEPSWSAVEIDGTPRMRERPMDTLLSALEELGARLEWLGRPGALPVRVLPSRLRGGSCVLERPASSQFVSALAIAGALASEPLEIVLREGTPARPYVDMTLRTLAAFGGRATWIEGDWAAPEERLRVEPSQLRACPRYVVEPDASAASYLLALAAIHGGEVTIPDLGAGSLQGDAGFWRVLVGFGAQGEQDEARTVVRKAPGAPLRGQELDLGDMPDMTLTAAVVALFAEGPTTITGVDVLRHHESDRLAAGARELRKLGAEVRELDDGLEIHPPAGGPKPGVVVDTYLDHRMAMAFAMVGEVGIADPGCVAKTFPDYFEVLAELGMLAGGDDRG